jgi:ElaB/YqjD/DUF883 family membrane-anchored ribosome-binding protein
MASNISSNPTGTEANPVGSNTTERLRDQARTVGRDLNELGHTAKAAAAEGAQQLREQARRMGERGRERAQELQDELGTYISDRPLKSVLVAAGAGLLLGYIMGRR